MQMRAIEQRESGKMVDTPDNLTALEKKEAKEAEGN
jgi:hypothetical protein